MFIQHSECRPELQLDFKTDFKDASGKNTAVAHAHVDIDKSSAIFNGEGEISIWRFTGAYIGTNLMIKVLFHPENNSPARQVIVGNCGNGHESSYGIEIDTADQVVIITADTVPRTPKTVELPLMVIYVFSFYVLFWKLLYSD